MFTGIIEETGEVQELKLTRTGARITVSNSSIWQELVAGESVCVNGVCLTVVERGRGAFSADISEESLGRSTLGRLKRGTSLNLERALKIDSRLGGHIVQGHVDGVGTVKSIQGPIEGRTYTFTYPQEMSKYLVEKGSIAIDGISLTVSTLGRGDFSVAVIPYTVKETNLKDIKVGDMVNLEVDVIAKYIRSYMEHAFLAQGTSAKGGESLYGKLLEGGFT